MTTYDHDNNHLSQKEVDSLRATGRPGSPRRVRTAAARGTRAAPATERVSMELEVADGHPL